MVTWEQDLWNDVLKSVESNAPAFPWGYGHASATAEARRRWLEVPQLSYKRGSARDKVIKLRRLVAGGAWPSPFGAPDHAHCTGACAATARFVFERNVTYMPLCAPTHPRFHPGALNASGGNDKAARAPRQTIAS